MFFTTIDWLSLTFERNNSDARQFTSIYSPAATSETTTAHHGYDTATRNKNGVLCMWHTRREEMGLHVVFSGSALRNIFEQRGVHPQEIIKTATHACASVTRLDLARDAQNEQIDLRAIKTAVEMGENKGNARTWAEMTSAKKGYTLYVGSRTSEKFIRMYNKGAEQGDINADWQRFEIECKGMIARAAAKAICDKVSIGAVFDDLAMASLELPNCADYGRLFPAYETQFSLPKIEKHTDTEKWIITQVIPAVEGFFERNPESTVYERLVDMLVRLAQSRE